MNFQEPSYKIFARVVLILILLTGLAGIPQRAARADTGFVVTLLEDTDDTNPGDGVCYNTAFGGCSLRGALIEASHSTVPVRITFNSSLAGGTINLSAGLGRINWTASQVTVDGETNNISISGAGLAAGTSVVEISGSNNTLTNLTIRDSKGNGIRVGDLYGVEEGNSNTLSYLYVFGNAYSGINVYAGHNNNIMYTDVGRSSTSNMCGTSVNNGRYGVLINGSAVTTGLGFDRIVCSGWDGVYIDTGSFQTVFGNNFIGSYGGNYSSGNSGSGVYAYHDNYTQIGYNVISRNGQYGIKLDGSTNTLVRGNTIGLNEAGDWSYPNMIDGILVTGGANNVEIGTHTDALDKNNISGNYYSGITISGATTHDITVEGNYIGLSRDGQKAIGNGYAGIAIYDAYNNNIGTMDGTTRQFISGNGREGIYTLNADNPFVEANNFIGVNSSFMPAGNGREGIKLDTGTNTAYIRAGLIAYNGLAGIALVGNTTFNNLVTAKAIMYNGDVPIDLGNDDFTPNGSHSGSTDGPNRWMEYPELNMMGTDGFSGISCAGCYVHIYAAYGDPTTKGNRNIYLTTVNADPVSGDFSYTFPDYIVAVTMQACNINYNCSELSPRLFNPRRPLFVPVIGRH